MNQKYCCFVLKALNGFYLCLASLWGWLLYLAPLTSACVITRYICFIYCQLPNTNTATARCINPSAAVSLNHPQALHAHTHTQRTLMQSRANTQTCPTLHLFTFYYLQPSLSSLPPSPVCLSFSSFFPDLIMLIKPIKSLAARWVNATVSSGHKDTFKHGAERRSEGRRGERKEG